MNRKQVITTITKHYKDEAWEARKLGLEPTIDSLIGSAQEVIMDEIGWDEIDNDLLLKHVDDAERVTTLFARNGNLSYEEYSWLSGQVNKALASFANEVAKEIGKREGLLESQ